MKRYTISVNNSSYEVTVNSISNGVADVEISGKRLSLKIAEHGGSKSAKSTPTRSQAPIPKKAAPTATPILTGNGIHAPIPGQIRSIMVKVGESVSAGQKVLVMEAMKMQNSITAKADGKVKAIQVKEGDAVAQNQLLIELE